MGRSIGEVSLVWTVERWPVSWQGLWELHPGIPAFGPRLRKYVGGNPGSHKGAASEVLVAWTWCLPWSPSGAVRFQMTGEEEAQHRSGRGRLRGVHSCP